jgi:hypothetical protein
MWQDLRSAIRRLNEDRRFSLLAILALALGIGSSISQGRSGFSRKMLGWLAF